MIDYEIAEPGRAEDARWWLERVHEELATRHRVAQPPRSFVDLVVSRLRDGDPFVIARDGSREVGAGIFAGLPGLEPDIIYGVGTWMHPLYRNRDIAKRIKEVAAPVAIARGYRRTRGEVAFTNWASIQSSLAFPATRIVSVVLESDLEQFTGGGE